MESWHIYLGIVTRLMDTHTVTHSSERWSKTLQHTTIHRNAHCNTLQYTATHTTTHCNTLQHTPQHTTIHCTTHHNTLQYTATHLLVTHLSGRCSEAQKRTFLRSTWLLAVFSRFWHTFRSADLHVEYIGGSVLDLHSHTWVCLMLLFSYTCVYMQYFLPWFVISVDWCSRLYYGSLFIYVGLFYRSLLRTCVYSSFVVSVDWCWCSCNALQCVAVRCSALQYVAERCGALQYVAVRCSALQCVAVCCSALQYIAVPYSAVQCIAVRCSVLQCVAVCCSAL